MRTEYHKVTLNTKQVPCTILIVFYEANVNLAIFEIDNFKDTEEVSNYLRSFNRHLSDGLCIDSSLEFIEIFDKFNISYEKDNLCNYNYLEECIRKLIKKA